MRLHTSAIGKLFPFLGTFALAACGGSVSPPDVIPGDEQTVNTGAFVQLDASRTSDPQNRLLTFGWSFLSRPLGSETTLVDAGSAKASFLADMPGEYMLKVTVSNTVRVNEATVKVTAMVCGASSPVVTDIAAQSDLVTGSTVQLTATVSDADNAAGCDLQQSLSHAWKLVQLPAGSRASLNSLTAQNPSFTADVAGHYIVQLVVTDSTGRSSAPRTLDVGVNDCTPSPIQWANPAITAVATDPQQGAPSFVDANGNPMPHVDAVVQLIPHATVVIDCGRKAREPLSFFWTLASRPADSEARLDSQTTQSPRFVVDKVGRYRLSVVATDARGIRSAPATIDLDTTTCGVNEVTTQLLAGGAAFATTAQSPQSVASFAPFTFGAAIVTADNDASACPTRFQVSADFNYRVAIEPSPGAASLTTVIGDETTFEARKPGAYAIEVDGAVTNRSGRVHAAPVVAFFSAAACDFSVGTPAISAVTPPAGDTFPRGLSFFAGDRVTVAATASSTPTCASAHDTFSYRWTLLETPVGSAAQLNSTTLAQPTFVVDVPGGSYRLQVEVTDSLGNVKTSAVQTFTAGTCGKNPISASASVLVAGALPFDPSTLKVAPRNGAFFSADDDAALCPARFAQTYTFAWSTTGGTFRAPSASQTDFAPGGSVVYSINATVTGSNGQSAVAALQVDARCSSPFVTSPEVDVDFAGSPVGSAPPRSPVSGSFNVYRDDAVTVSTTAASTCFGAAHAGLTYDWTLTAADGRVRHLSTASALFTIDQPNGNYSASVVVKDALGNGSFARAASFKAAACGATPIFAAINDTAGARPFDDHVFAAGFAAGRTTFSDDDVASVCPARFANQYAFAWSVAGSTPDVGSIFSSDSHGQSVTFSPGGNAVFNVKLIVSGAGRQTEAFRPITVSCSDVTPKAGAISVTSSTPDYAPGIFFRDDIVALSTAAPTSLCFSSMEAASFLWSLTRPPASTNTTPFDITAAHPTFVADVASGTWTATVVVVDKLGNRSAPRTQSFTSQSCGINPVLVNFTDTRVGMSPFAAFDPHDLVAIASSNDDDAALCPARFKNSYTFTNLTVTPPTGATSWAFTPSGSNSGRFEAGENGTYHVAVDAKGSASNVTGHGTFAISVDCSSGEEVPVVTAPTVAQIDDPERVTVNGKIFRGETVTVATTVTAACYTGTNFHPAFVWEIASTDASAALTPDATVTAPSFVVAVAGAAYAVRATVRDQWANGPGTNDATFVAETCGANPVVVTFTAPTQQSGSSPFDPWSAAALATSNDSNTAICPQARFHDTYQITWAVSATPMGAMKYSLSSFTGDLTTFREGEGASGTYTLTATGTAVNSGHTGTASQNITTATCTSPTPTFTNEASDPAIGFTVTPASADGFYSANPQSVFTGDTVNLSSPTTFACYTNQAEAAAQYTWGLKADVGSTPTLTGGIHSTTPNFVADAPNKTFHARLNVQDHWGNADARRRDLTSGNCGAAPIAAMAATTQAGGALPMDPWTLTAWPASGTHFSDDSDPDKCPARFAPMYRFAWSSVDALSPAFSSTTTNPATFRPADSKSYAIHVLVSANGQSATADTTVNATCAAPTVDTPTVAQVNGAAFGSTIFVGDAVKVATSATSACFASPTFTYAYTLKQGAVTASETFSPSPTVAQPTFVPQVFGASYEVSVTIGDGSGQTSSPTTSLAIAVSSCGVTSPTVSFTATQHLESVQQKVGTDTPTTALDLTQKSGATTTTITIDVGGTSQAIEVPFYLATPVDVALKAAAPSCSSVTFNSAQLFDPDGHEVPTTDWTQPSPQSVSADTLLVFTFTPRIGDHVVSGDPVPGHYTLALSLTFGGSNSSQTTTVNSSAVEVEGRCGLNAPVVDANFDPATQSIDLPVTVDAIVSDADTEVLFLDTGSSTSSGCGLNQSFSYAWSFATQPLDSTGTFADAHAASTTFTANTDGSYSVQLVVGDGTTSGESGNGTTSRSFPYEVAP